MREGVFEKGAPQVLAEQPWHETQSLRRSLEGAIGADNRTPDPERAKRGYDREGCQAASDRFQRVTRAHATAVVGVARPWPSTSAS